MKRALMTFATGLVMSAVLGSIAEASDRRSVKCPVVVDRTTGKYTAASSKYRCFRSSRDAVRSGYKRYRFGSEDRCQSDDDSSPGSSLRLKGPGEKRSVVFSAPKGGTIAYSFPGGGEFEVDVYLASSDERVERLLETEVAKSGTVNFSGRTSPVFVKVEGPGSWTADISAAE